MVNDWAGSALPRGIILFINDKQIRFGAVMDTFGLGLHSWAVSYGVEGFYVNMVDDQVVDWRSMITTFSLATNHLSTNSKLSHSKWEVLIEVLNNSFSGTFPRYAETFP